MPPITRVFIKAALTYFVVALFTGFLLVAVPWLPLPAWVSALNPVYFHLFMVGWVTQLIVGVAYWMFPKFSREQPRGSDMMAWSAFVLLNAGLVLRIISEPANTFSPGGLWGLLLAVSALLQWIGGVIFIANTWPRVKEK